MTTISELRTQIDAVDDQIAELLLSRAELVSKVRDQKIGNKINTYIPAREAEIFTRLATKFKSQFLPEEKLVSVFKQILSVFRGQIGAVRVGVVAFDVAPALLELGTEISVRSCENTNGVLSSLLVGEIECGVVELRDLTQLVSDGEITSGSHVSFGESELLVVSIFNYKIVSGVDREYALFVKAVS